MLGLMQMKWLKDQILLQEPEKAHIVTQFPLYPFFFPIGGFGSELSHVFNSDEELL